MNVVNEEINKNNILIFTKKNCSYCVKSLDILNSLDLQYKNIELKGKTSDENVDTIEFVLHALTGQKTVPNIFIRGEHIGGYTDLLKLYNDDTLLLKLDYVKCDYCNKFQIRKNVCECLHTIKNTNEWGQEL